MAAILMWFVLLSATAPDHEGSNLKGAAHQVLPDKGGSNLKGA